MEIEYRKLNQGRIVAKYYVRAGRAAIIDQMLADEGHVSNAHGNCKPVIIWGDVDQEEYGKRIREHGAQPITDRLFPSSKAASRHFGYRLWDAVGQALCKARERGEAVAMVGGVPVRRANEIPGID